MEPVSLFLRFAVALAIGILVGLQRQYALSNSSDELAAGVRTFGLIALIGAAAAMLGEITQSVLPLIGLYAIVGVLLTVTHFIQAWRNITGLTTEIAVLITLVCGSLVFYGYIALAVALGVTTTILLSFKIELHTFARHLTKPDIFSTLKFAFISLIVLPVLPRVAYGPEPFNIFNPYLIWLLVVFISGISFVGYILIKIIGPSKGISLTGLLGGLASSTAVTLSFTQKSKENSALSKSFALAILIAWTVMFVRLLIEVAAVNPGLFQHLWIPVTASVIVGLFYCLYLYRARHDYQDHHMTFTNPFELGPAIKFGLIFVLILFISKAAQVYFGNAGIYVASFVSGLADVDAIALSLAKLSGVDGGTEPAIAVRAIVLAAVANTLSKGVIVLAGGSREIRKAILPGFLLMMVTIITTAFLIQ